MFLNQVKAAAISFTVFEEVEDLGSHSLVTQEYFSYLKYFLDLFI